MGWTYHYSNIKDPEAYQGTHYGRIAKGADYGIKQTVTIPETGYYDLSAFIQTKDDGAVMGLQTLNGAYLTSSTTKRNEQYTQAIINDIPLEAGETLNVFFTGTHWEHVKVDNVKLAKNLEKAPPLFNQVITFSATAQRGATEINKQKNTINFSVPFNTDISQISISNIQVSEGSTSSIQTGDTVDFSSPVEILLTDSNGKTDVWTATATIKEKEVAVSSSNKDLESSFNWAIDKTRQFVMTDKNGLINRDENKNDGTGRDNYIPSYWAGYYDRTAFYSRDFLHQAAGAKMAGLDQENFSMFHTFAIQATEARKWYTLWAINFNGSAHTIDYYHDDYFVREVPAQFEFLEKAYEQYLWTGDVRYIHDKDLWQFYTKVVTDYIDLHDTQKSNGVAEGYGGIFEGSATYNERGEFPIEAGDGIGSQYQAFVAYSKILEARGELSEAEVWKTKASELKAFFNNDWSIKDPDNHDPLENYVNIVQKDGIRLNDFGKENSWFMPMKLITEPGARNDNYLDFISENLGNGIGSTPESPYNIEAYTYLPEVFFPYNRNEEAWKWMQYIIDKKDEAHERPTQGTNGDYPEISFTFVSNTVEGLMGIEPNAPEHRVVTASRLPTEVEWLEVDYLPMGAHELKIRHDGLNQTTLTNTSEQELTWEARFYGEYPHITVDGVSQTAEQKEVNGVTVSFITVPVHAGQQMTAHTGTAL